MGALGRRTDPVCLTGAGERAGPRHLGGFGANRPSGRWTTYLPLEARTASFSFRICTVSNEDLAAKVGLSPPSPEEGQSLALDGRHRANGCRAVAGRDRLSAASGRTLAPYPVQRGLQPDSVQGVVEGFGPGLTPITDFDSLNLRYRDRSSS